MTLNGHYALHCTKNAFFGDYNENLNEGRLTHSHYGGGRACSPMTLVSYDIRRVVAGAGFSGEGASNDSRVIEDVDFHCLLTLNFRDLRNYDQHYYIVSFSPLSPFH